LIRKDWSKELIEKTMATATQETRTVTVNGLDAATMLRQLGFFVALAASFVIAGWVLLWSQEPNYSVLFSSLEEREASIVLDALQQLNIQYKLDNKTGALLVPSKSVYDARINLAAQGLPKSTAGGFASLDNGDSTFGMSAAKETILFQRALERELVQTVNSISNVKSSRIHLAIPKQSAFLRDRQKPRASVIVSLYPGRSLSEGQVSAIVHLVASSVPNLQLEQVTVVDQTGRLLTNGDRTKDIALSSTQFEYARKIEKSYQERIQNILTPILGPNSVHAQVTAEIDFTVNEQTQQIFNPDSQTPVSVQTSEEQTSGGAFAGIPGALSNQPPQNAEAPEKASEAAADSGGGTNRMMRKETKNYEVDKTISHTRYASGNIKRLSAAVVVDDKVNVNKDGVRSKITRSPEEILRITELVKKAIGFDLKRGDTVNVVNESFTVPETPEQLPETPIWERPWIWDVAKQALAGLLLIFIVFGVLKPALKSFGKSIAPSIALPPGEEGKDGRISGASGVQADKVTLGSGGAVQIEAPPSQHDMNMLTAQQLVKDDPKLVAQVVKNWVSNE